MISEEGPTSPLRSLIQLCVLFGAYNRRSAVEVESVAVAVYPPVECQKQIRVEMSLGRVRPGLESIPEGLADDESVSEHETCSSHDSLTPSNSTPESGPHRSL